MGNIFTFFTQKLPKSPELIEYKIWMNTDDQNFIYPENLELEQQFKDKSDIGIALPGGGNIASTYSLGCLRALHELQF